MKLEVNVNVNLGLTEEVSALVGGFLGASLSTLTAAAEIAGTDAAKPSKAIAAPTEEQTATKVKAPKATKAAKAPKATEVPTEEAPTEAVAEEQAAPTPTEEAPTEQPKPLSETDIRKAMDAVFERFEGPDFRDNKESEAHKKYHKKLITAFKGIARWLGYERPSQIVEQDKIASFIAACEGITLDDKGEISNALPF